MLRVQAQHGKFGLAQAAGVVQQFHRHQRLAHFVYQPGLPGLPGVTGQAALRIVQAQLACQRHQQRTHGHRMQLAVVVAAFQTRQADQRALVALRRAGDVAHQRQAALHIDGAAPARFVEQGHHGCTAAFADGSWQMADGSGLLQIFGHVASGVAGCPWGLRTGPHADMRAELRADLCAGCGRQPGYSLRCGCSRGYTSSYSYSYSCSGSATSGPSCGSLQHSAMPLARTSRRSSALLSTKRDFQNGCASQWPSSLCRCMPKRNGYTAIFFGMLGLVDAGRDGGGVPVDWQAAGRT